MEAVILFGVVGAILIAIVVYRVRAVARTRSAVRDDTRRAGVPAVPDSATAFQSAQGKAAWTRLSGFSSP